MKEVLKYIYDNLLTIITVIIALIALWQTHKQIKISNKQFLFEKRMDKYITFKGILKLYEENKNLLNYESKDDEPIIVYFNFINLVNNGYLEHIGKVIENPYNNDYKKEFLLKLEEIKKLSDEFRFLFKYKNIELISDFIYSYQDVLLELYKYQVLMKCIEKNKTPSREPKDYKTLKKEFGEQKHRDRLYGSIKKLEDRYNKMISKKIIDKIESKIQLSD